MTAATRRFLKVFLFLMFLPSVCSAGQIHYQDITLSQVPLTLLVQFLSEVVAGKKIKVKVLKVWKTVKAPADPSGPAIATEIVSTDDTEYQVGAEIELALQEPYVWDNPRKSPIVTRYWDVSDKLPKPGENLLLVDSFYGRFEPTAYTAAKAAKFELVANQKAFADSLHRAANQTLIDNYRDRDLRALSFAEARKRPISLVDFLKGTSDRNSFAELLQYFYYTDPVERAKSAQNTATIAKNVAAFSDDQKAWFAYWMNTNLSGAEYVGVKIDFLLASPLKSELVYAEYQRFALDFYRQLEAGMKGELVEKFSRLFLKALGDNPAKIGDSLNGSLVEKMIKSLTAAEGPKLRLDFVAVVAKASKQAVIEKDPQHLFMYFLISHLREAKDTAAIDKFTEIDFHQPLFKAYFQYAVELLIDDEKSQNSHNRARVQKFAESYPAGEFLAKMDADKRVRYDDFVK